MEGSLVERVQAAITFAGFLAGFIFYLCVGNYQRAKRAMDRQRKRRLELEEEKRALASPRGGINSNGSGARRRINYDNEGYDSPRSLYSGSSSMYTAEKGLTVGVGGVTVEGNRSHMLLGGDHGTGGTTQFAGGQQQSQAVTHPPRDLLDDADDGGVNSYGNLIQQTPSQGEMSV